MALTNEEAHALSRKRGTSWVYETARFVLTPIAAVWYRFKVTGREYVPPDGPVIIAPNHKSFYDSFFIGLATTRHLHFMAKTELFEGKKTARLLSGLGAFPVRRGTADPAALETARLHLEKGRVLAMFPEGTRHRDPATLKEPRRGVGRLAIEAGRADRPVRDHRHGQAVRLGLVPEADEGPGLLRPRDLPGGIGSHPRGGAGPDREPGLAGGRARVQAPAREPGPDRRDPGRPRRRGWRHRLPAAQQKKKRRIPVPKVKLPRRKKKNPFKNVRR